VRTAAQIEPVAGRVVGDHGVGREAVDQLDLVGLAHLVEHRAGVAARDLVANERLVRVDDLLHLGLDPPQVLLGERLRRVEVVVEAGFDRRTDRHLRPRKQALHGFCHHVRGRVA
jgi:hypothetical protein